MRLILSRAMLLLALFNMAGLSSFAQAADHNHNTVKAEKACCEEGCPCPEGGECTSEECGCCGEQGCACEEGCACCEGGECTCENCGCCEGGSCGQGGCSGGTCTPGQGGGCSGGTCTPGQGGCGCGCECCGGSKPKQE